MPIIAAQTKPAPTSVEPAHLCDSRFTTTSRQQLYGAGAPQFALASGPHVSAATPIPPSFPFSAIPIHYKLKVGAVDDPMEGEADRIAEQVMRLPEPSRTGSAQGVLRRKCACGSSGAQADECEECQKSQGTVQRAALQTGGPQVAPAAVHDIVHSPGQPLDAA